MATELQTSSLQALADITALIYDRAVSPEKVVGQAWLISKGRVMTTASAVANYAEAPWALVIKFPHPDVTYGVRTVQLHPDFNKREARDHYLSQAWNTSPTPGSFENDIATLALDSDLSPPPPERVAELNRALAVPFEISPRDMSGSMRPGDLPSILQSALSTGRSGLLTIVDARNIPFARIGIRQARITKVCFAGLYNELALCELLFRKPTGNFAFQPIEDFRWPSDLHELSTTAEQIVQEGVRRADELPRVIEMLGGMDIRFAKATKYADFSTVKPHERWIAEKLWEVFDGFMPLSKVSERIGADTYSTIKMVWEFANMGLIAPNQQKAFHSSGQIGPMLVPAQDLELNVWDTITAFYLDPVSGNPMQTTGNLFGPARVLNNKTLLHTVTLPPDVNHAAMLKDGKLIGVYTGPFLVRGNNAPPMGLNRMAWVGALSELGAKRLRTNEVQVGENGEPVDPEKDQATSQRISLRSRAMTQATELPQIPLPEEEETGPLAKFTKEQLAMAAGGSLLLCFIMMLMGLFSPHGAPPAATTPATATSTATATTTSTTPVTASATSTSTSTTTGDASDANAAKLAYDLAGLGAPPEGFTYKDSSALTAPKASWEVTSPLKDLDIVFVLWPNPTPLQNNDQLSKVASAPPFSGLTRAEGRDEYSGETDHIKWVGGHYKNDKGDLETSVVGVMPCTQNTNNCVVFFAKPLTEKNLADFAVPTVIIEQMINRGKEGLKAASGAASTSAGPGSTAELATPEQLTDYRKKLATLIQSNYKQPKTADKDAETKVGMMFSIDEEGKVGELQIVSNPNDDFNKAFQKAFDASQPMPKPPKTKTGKYSLMATAEKGTVSVEEQ